MKPNKNKGRHNIMNSFIKNGLVALVITFILVVIITLIGFMFANSDLEDNYNSEMAEYEDELSAYNSEMEAYNQKLAAAEQFQSTGIMTASVSVNTQHVNSQSVGNEISYTTTVNGQRIDYMGTVQIQKDSAINLYSKVVDDEKHPDVGTASKSVTPNIEELTSDTGYNATLTCRVHETYGRAAGNTAIYDSTFTIKVDPESVKSPEEIIAPSEPTEPYLEQIGFGDYLSQSGYFQFLCIMWIIGLIIISVKWMINNGKQ